MVSITRNQLISHQAFNPRKKQLVGILEDDKDVVYYVNFELDKDGLLLARVKHRLGNPKIPETLLLKEKQIRYMREGAFPHEAELLCDSLQRSEIICKIAQRTVVIRDIEIDQKFYTELNNCSKSIKSLEHDTHILVGPDPVLSKPKTPLKVDSPCDPPSSEDSEHSHLSREESIEEEEPPLLPKMTLHLTPDTDS